jgi:hypothetical protein
MQHVGDFVSIKGAYTPQYWMQAVTSKYVAQCDLPELWKFTVENDGDVA